MQGVVLRASPRNPLEINSLTQVKGQDYEAIPKINKRGSDQDRERIAQNKCDNISFKSKRDSPPFWIALDEVQDPQVRSQIVTNNMQIFFC